MAQTVKITPASGKLEFIGNITLAASTSAIFTGDAAGSISLVFPATQGISLTGKISVTGSAKFGSILDSGNASGTLNYVIAANGSGGYTWTDVTTIIGAIYAPLSRTITIDGVSQDLSADRTWNILPTAGLAGQILAKSSDTNYAVEWIDNYTSTVKHLVKLGENMTAGTAVYVTGTTGQSGTNMIVSKASNSMESTSSKTLGLLQTGGNTNDIVFVITEGLLAGINTSTANAGDPVWLGTNGNLIFGLANKPVAPAHLVFIGVVTRVQQNNGEIFVKVQNGFELKEIHDVLINGTSTGQLLRLDSDGLWKNWTPTYISAESDTLATVTARGATTSSAISITNSTQATNSTSGALTVTGGVGIGGNLYVGGNLVIGGTTTTVNAQNLTVSDNMIYLNNGVEATIIGIETDGASITYTTEHDHNYTVGMSVTIIGVDPDVYNFSNRTITAVETNSFTIAGTVTDPPYASGGTARAKSNANPDIGFAAGYNDGSYAHTGLFRDASDNIFKFFKGYTPEPDASPFIDTTHGSFQYASVRADQITGTAFIKVGGTSSQFLKADGSVDSTAYLSAENDPYRITAAAVTGTSTKTLTITRADASTVTATWTDYDTDTNTYVTSAAFNTGNGILTLTRNDAGTVTVDLDGRYSEIGHTHTLSISDSGYINIAGDDDYIYSIDSRDRRALVDLPSTFSRGLYLDFKNPAIFPELTAGGYKGQMIWRAYGSTTDMSGGYPMQIVYDQAGDIHYRLGVSLTAWQDAFATIASQQWVQTQGYLTALPSHTHDDRYYTETEIGQFFAGTTAITGYNKTNWDAAYGDKINSAAVTGTTTKTLTLTQQDGGTVTATWTDYDSDTDAQTLSWDAGTLRLTISGGNTAELTGLATQTYVTSQGYITGITSSMVTTALGYTPWHAGNDGAGSGLDADLLDGLSSGSFLRSDDEVNYTGNIFRVYTEAGSTGDNPGSIDTLQIYQSTANRDAFQTFHISGDYAVHFGLDGATNDLFVGGWSMGPVKYRIWHEGNLTNLNQLTNGPGYITSAALAGLATQTYVNTQISNLIDSAPAALDTLNELAAALGDDANFATTITTSIGNKVSKSGDTMTGNLAFGATSNLGITWGLNTDTAFIKFISTGNQAGGSYLEIGTTDDGDEEIKFTQSGNVRYYLATDGYLKTGAGYKYVYENGTWGISISGNSATTSQTEFGSLTIGGRLVATEDFVINQGYITSYTEVDTLDSVTDRNATTTNAITVGGVTSNGDINMGANQIVYGQSNVAAPSTTDQHAGSRMILYPLSGGMHYAMGIESGHMWFNTDQGFKWYHRATTLAMHLDTTNLRVVAGNIYASGTIGNLAAGTLGQQLEPGDSTVTTLRFDSDSWQVYSYDAGTVMTISGQNGGRIGIGTTLYDRGKLVVMGPATTYASGNGQLAVLSEWNGSSYSAADNGARIVLGGPVSSGDRQRTFASIGGFKENSTEDNRDGYFAIATRGGGADPDLIERLRVTSTGKIGINTISPTARLTVSGSTAGESLFEIYGTNGLLFAVNDDLSNSLFSANTIAGLPVIEAFADGSVVMGPFATPVTITTTGQINTTSHGNSSQWIAGYNDRIVSAAVSGGPTKTLTLTQQDGGTVTASWSDTDTDTNTYLTSAAFNTSTGVLTLTRNDAVTVTVDLDDRYAYSSHTHSIDNLTDASRLFNNMGQNHSAYTDFNGVGDFGFRYVNGSTNGPGTGSSQFYSVTFGLGNDYSFANYAMQIAIPRYNSSDRYVTFRTREATTWGSWYKIYAGYADSAGNSTTTSQTEFASLTIGGRPVATQDWVTSQGYLTSVTDVWVNTTGDTMTGALTINTTGTSGAATLRLNNSSSTTFIHTLEAMGANMTSGQHNILVVGKAASTKNSGYIGYYWAADASNSNFVTLGHWGSDDLVRIYGNGATEIYGNTTILNAGQLFINNSSPTVYLQDSDHRSSMIHVNSGNFYILNGSGTNSQTWAQQANSRWALQINLADNYTTFGGVGDFPTDVYAGTSFRAPIFYDSVNTNYYLDPNSQSVLYNVQVSNVLRVGPNYHIQQNANGDLEFKYI